MNREQRSIHRLLPWLVLVLGLLATSIAQASGLPPAHLRLYCGDCNLDNRIDMLDSKAAANHASGAVPITGPRRRACDVDRDGFITIRDALMIEQVAYGIIPSGWRGCATCGDCSATVSPPFAPDGAVDNNDLNALVWEALFGNSLFDSAHAACDITGDGVIDSVSDYSELANSCYFVPGGPFPVCAQCGDCDLDGDVDSDDEDRAAEAAAGLIVLNGLELGVCDINKTGSMDVLDALLIAQRKTSACLARP